MKRDDYPPPRVMKDPIPEGASKGSFVPEEEFESMLNAYFEARGWSKEGIPTKKKLEELGINDVAGNAVAQME